MSNLSTSSIDDIIRRGVTAYQQGDLTTAQKIASDLIKRDNQSADVWYYYALVMENTDLRLKALDRALTIKPDHARALALRAQLDVDDDPFSDIAPAPKPYSQPSPYSPTPVINVNVMQSNTQTNAQTIGGTRINGPAFWIGFLVQAFLGIAGLSHLMNGKVGGALGAFIVGSIIWPIVAISLTVVTAGICGLAVLPVHIYLAYSMSRTGAQITG